MLLYTSYTMAAGCKMCLGGGLEKSFFYSCWDLEAERECFSMQVDGNWNYSYMNFWLFILDILLHTDEPQFSVK